MTSRVEEIWAAATPATAHPFLEAARVRAYGLRTYRKPADDGPDEFLLIPVHNPDGELAGLQFFHPSNEGPDFFPRDLELRGGEHLIIGEPNGSIAVLEDYLSAARHYETTGEAVAVAFTAMNVEQVVRVLAAKYPAARVDVGGAAKTGVSTPEDVGDADHGAPDRESETRRDPAVALTFTAAPTATPAACAIYDKASEASAAEQVALGVSEVKVNIWMPFYLGDYLADTQRLTTEQHGAYILLILDYWRSSAPPDDDVVLATITRLPPQQWRLTRSTLEPYFQIRDGRWFHKRVELELNKARKNRQERHDHSMMMHAAKREKRKSNAASSAYSNAAGSTTRRGNGELPTAMPVAMPTACSSPSPTPSSRTSTTAADAANELAFEEIWPLYPRRDGDNPKRRAFKAYRARLSEGHTAEEIKAGVERYAAWVRARGKEGTEMVKQAATFFGSDKPFLLPWDEPAPGANVSPIYRRQGVM